MPRTAKSKAAAPALARFIKVSAAGALLAADATDWSGVYIPAAGLIIARSPTAKSYTFKGAQQACREFDLCGAPAERPISVAEFYSHLVDNTRYNPVLDPSFFTLADPHTLIWTCDECMPAGGARFVYLGSGLSGWHLQDFRCQALAVRASQFPLASGEAA